MIGAVCSEGEPDRVGSTGTGSNHHRERTAIMADPRYRATRGLTISEKLAFHSAPATSGCRLWRSGTFNRGYGKIWIGGKNKKAHRVAWEVAHGPISDGLYVLHRCDTPACINVEHLFLGTAADNSTDMVAKDRQPKIRGERHGQSKLTVTAVLSIRASPEPATLLAGLYGVTESLIHQVRRRQVWRHV